LTARAQVGSCDCHGQSHQSIGGLTWRRSGGTHHIVVILDGLLPFSHVFRTTHVRWFVTHVYSIGRKVDKGQHRLQLISHRDRRLTGSIPSVFARGRGAVMNAPRIPKDDLSRVGVHMLPLASSIVEPLQLFGGVMVGIHRGPASSRRFMCGEKLLV
jgi:hypothetical protein